MSWNAQTHQVARGTSHRPHNEASLVEMAAGAALVAGVVIGAGGIAGIGALLFVGWFLTSAYVRRGRGWLARGWGDGRSDRGRVDLRLMELELCGWLVEQDIPNGRGGRIDFLVHAPGTTFLISRRSRRCAAGDIAEAHRNADWALRRYGDQREVVAVISVEDSSEPAALVDGVYAVRAPALRGFLLDRG